MFFHDAGIWVKVTDENAHVRADVVNDVGGEEKTERHLGIGSGFSHFGSG